MTFTWKVMYMVLVLKCQKIDLYMEQSDLRMEGHLYGLCLKVSSNLYMEGHLNGLGLKVSRNCRSCECA